MDRHQRYNTSIQKRDENDITGSGLILQAVSETDLRVDTRSRNMIRATYGHTVEIELDLPTENIPSSCIPMRSRRGRRTLEAGLIPSELMSTYRVA